mmetsp:Transcript_103445/g.297887  ORF Transcript_103445/g.297887 Transcript_103445/m.297887 type:complete len:321 (+) Transcript_103445:2206-3168(+)
MSLDASSAPTTSKMPLSAAPFSKLSNSCCAFTSSACRRFLESNCADVLICEGLMNCLPFGSCTVTWLPVNLVRISTCHDSSMPHCFLTRSCSALMISSAIWASTSTTLVGSTSLHSLTGMMLASAPRTPTTRQQCALSMSSPVWICCSCNAFKPTFLVYLRSSRVLLSAPSVFFMIGIFPARHRASQVILDFACAWSVGAAPSSAAASAIGTSSDLSPAASAAGSGEGVSCCAGRAASFRACSMAFACTFCSRCTSLKSIRMAAATSSRSSWAFTAAGPVPPTGLLVERLALPPSMSRIHTGLGTSSGLSYRMSPSGDIT